MNEQILEFNAEKEIVKDKKINLNTKSVNYSSIDGEYRKSMFYVNIKLNNSPYCHFTIIPSPTANCQIYSIGCAEIIFRDYFTKDERLFMLRECQKIVGKNQLLLDITQSYENTVEEIFDKSYITFKNRYINTKYSSEMTMYLIKTDILK